MTRLGRRGWFLGLSSLFLIAVAALVVSRVVAVVDATEFGVVNEFGRPIRVLGDQKGEAGPHLVAPWQSVLKVDRRLQIAEPGPRDLLTADKKAVEVWPYFAWRVRDPVRFLQAAGSLSAAEQRLEERISSALAASVARSPFEILASSSQSNDEADPLDPVLTAILTEATPAAARELGVEIVDLGLRRVGYPLEVRPALFELIRSERRQVAATLRAEGETDYQTRVSQAERERQVTLAKAEAEAARIEAEGESAALAMLNTTHAQDPGLYEFLRTLETYRSLFDGKATVVLSTASPLFRLLREGPTAEPQSGADPAISRPLPSAALGVDGGRP